MKSTRKITSAMKMVAASKLRKAQLQAEASKPYAEKMAQLMRNVAASVDPNSAPELLTGKRDAHGNAIDHHHLVVLFTSNRGLCGGFNANAIKLARLTVANLLAQGKDVKILCVGRKGQELLKRQHAERMLKPIDTAAGDVPDFELLQDVSKHITAMFAVGEIDHCTAIYNEFISPIEQKALAAQIIPMSVPTAAVPAESDARMYEYEPSEEAVLEELLPRNINVQLYGAFLESAAGEHGARMSAMDNATRNAGDMIKDLSLQYNRGRQAAITTELTEIISGAESV